MLGKIMLIGGAEEKNKDGEILKKVYNLSLNKKIGIIPTGFKRDPLSVSYKYEDCFKGLGFDVFIFDIREIGESDKSVFMEKLECIDTIFFTGGDQERLYNIFANTRFLKGLKRKLKDKTINYIGTSAGAAIVGEKTFFGGDYKGYEKGSISFSNGFCLLENMIVDTHFSKRARLPRLCQALVSSHIDIGIGINENTAIIVGSGEVLGEGCVFKLDGSEVKNNYFKVGIGEKLNFENFKLDISFDKIIL